MTTSHISTIDAKEEFSDLINRVSHYKERIVLTRRGKEIAAIVPIEDLAHIQQTQNKNDLDEAVEAFQEARTQGSTSLDDLKEKIG